MTEKSEAHPIYSLQSPWQENSHNVWLASTLTLSRNLAKFKFPPKLDRDRGEQVISLIYEGLKPCQHLNNPRVFRSQELKPIEKEFLLEHYLVVDSFHMAHSGEGFIIDDGGNFLAVINLQNHLQLKLLDVTQDVEKSWNRLIKIEECIGKHVDLAFNPRFGFLTSDPGRCGTGLIITLFLHIPAVIHTGELPELLEKDKEEEIEILGLQGNSQEMIGDLLLAQNACTIGLTEEYILTSLRMWATRAVVAEVTARKRLKESPNESIKNKITRALGLLTHSYQLETIEALNALSLVKLGFEIGWIQGPETLNFNQIFFNCRRAHLLNALEKKVEVPELPRKRAEFLQSIAKQLTPVL